MKQILIISYHSLPFDVIASYRANAYLKHFKSFGLEPTLLTHYIGMTEENSKTIEEHDYGTVIRVPIKKSMFGRITHVLERIPVVNKFSIFCRWIGGYLDARPEDIDSYFSMKRYCFHELDIDQFDVVLGIFSPHHHLRLCYRLHEKFRIPYVLDFRDLWDNRIIHKNYSPDFTEGLQDSLTKNHWRRWLKKATFFSITSMPWKEKMESLTDINGHVITNGFDQDVFSKNESNAEEFIVLHAGSLYQHQDLDIFLIGARMFIDDMNPQKFRVKFIGADRTVGIKDRLSGFMYDPVNRIRKYLDEEFCAITKRIPKSEMISEMENASLLLFPSFPEAAGTYAGKIFDYLASNRNILMVPNDHGVVEELILKTQSGHICNSPKDVYEYLKSAYLHWEDNSELPYDGDVEEINNFSRESQVSRMSDLIKMYDEK